MIKVLLLIATIVMSTAAADETIKPPDKENKGIMATIALVYQTTREAVKFAYNELQYAYDVRDNVKALGAWFKKSRESAVTLYDYSSKLWTDPQNVFMTMKRMENIFDGAENLVFSTAYEFDAALSDIEDSWDKAAGPVLFPQTDKILAYAEDMMISAKMLPNSVSEADKNSPVATVLDENDQDVKVLQLSIALAADAIAQSRAYSKWTEKEMENIGSIEKRFEDAEDESVVSKDMQALWYSIEKTNTQSKLLQHQTNELAVSTGLLGFKVYRLSQKKAVEKASVNTLRSFALEFKNNPYRQKMIAKAEKEKWEGE